ncbi:hypothetical protein, conserved [Eimeria praecox]|uniref:Uncharacterized protein n=1 Tax=Eimeria praecox TaxID=51316 RepID=U6H1A3_9EIME|nr:hypothetical protein, conserved [Eimeria praecox]
MQHLPDIEVGSGDMLTERDTFGAPPDLQRLGEARGRQKILGSIRRSPTTCVSRAWAVLLTALAVATLLTKCFRVFGGWSRYEDRGRRLAGGNSEPPDDPDTRAIVDLCLEMEEIDPTLTGDRPVYWDKGDLDFWPKARGSPFQAARTCGPRARADAACHTDESDPEEGPSSGLRTLPTASTQAAQQENAKKRKWGPEGLSSTSVVTTHVSTPAPKKRATSLLEELLFPPETPESLQPVAFPNPKQHLFYRLPRLTPSAVRTSFCVPFAFSSNKLLTVPYYGILALRNFLAKEAVIGKEVTSAIRASERLVNCLFHYHVDTVTNLKPHEAVRVLGIRYLALDGLVAMLDLLGDAMHADDWWDGLVGVIPSDVRYNSPYLSLPLRSSNALLAIKLSDAIGKLKQRQRLSAGDTVELKQSLFCRYCSPAYFKNAKWNAWREDDSVSLEASYEQEWTAARERPVEEENKTK